MAGRTVAVRLTAEVGSYITGMQNSAKATRDLASTALDTAARNKAAFDQVGRSALAIGATAALGVGAAVSKFADFDAAMSGVQAATHESAAAMADLRDAALEAGARTAFSATEAADGIEQLAKAGVSTEAILNGGLNGALDLAAAGSLDVGAAAEIAATAMTQFSLAGDQIPHVADLLAAAAGKAQGEVSDMGMALKQSGLVAAQTGLTIEETTTALASFASAGLLGSDAGTSLKTMLQRLTPTSDEAAGAMQELGFSAYDSQGNFVGLEALAREMQTSFSGLTVEQRNLAMATIFGSDAVRAASVLYEQGAAGIADWTTKVNDAGYAQETAAIKLDNLKGDVEAFMGSVETALIKTGSAGDDLARGSVQAATSVVNAYGALPASMQGTVLAVGGVTAVVGTLGGAFLLALPRIAETRAAMKTLSTEMPRATTAMHGVTRAAAGFAAFGVATQILNGLVLATSDTADGVETATKRILAGLTDVDRGFSDLDTWQESAGSLEEALQILADPGLANRLGDLGGELLSFGGNEGSYRRTAIIEQLNGLGEGLAKLVTEGRADLAAQRFDEFAEAAEQAGMDVEDLRRLMPAYGEALAGAANETTLAAQATATLGEEAGQSAEDLKAAAEALKELADVDASFVNPLGAYQDALAGKEEAERKTAEKTAAATKSAEDSWEDFVREVKLSLAEYLAELEKQVQAQSDWEANMIRLAGRVSQGVLEELQNMGQEGAPLVAELVGASDAELSKLETLFEQRSQEATTAFADTLTKAQPVLAAISAKAGDAAARAVGERLAAGKTTIAAVMEQYGFEITNGVVRPIQQARTRLDGLTASLDRMDRKVIGVTIRYDEVLGTTVRRGEGLLGGTVTERAAGGAYPPGALLVGEKGPELLFPSTDGYVLNNRAMLDAMNAGASPFADRRWVSGAGGSAGGAGGPSTVDNRKVSLTVHGKVDRDTHAESIHLLRDAEFELGFR